MEKSGLEREMEVDVKESVWGERGSDVKSRVC